MPISRPRSVPRPRRADACTAFRLDDGDVGPRLALFIDSRIEVWELDVFYPWALIECSIPDTARNRGNVLPRASIPARDLVRCVVGARRVWRARELAAAAGAVPHRRRSAQ